MPSLYLKRDEWFYACFICQAETVSTKGIIQKPSPEWEIWSSQARNTTVAALDWACVQLYCRHWKPCTHRTFTKKKKKGTSSKTLASDRPHNGSGDLYSDCTGIMRGFVACVTNQNSYSTSAIWLSYNQAQQTQLHVLFAYAPITQQEPRYCHRVRGSHTILAYDPGDRIEFPKDP